MFRGMTAARFSTALAADVAVWNFRIRSLLHSLVHDIFAEGIPYGSNLLVELIDAISKRFYF